MPKTAYQLQKCNAKAILKRNVEANKRRAAERRVRKAMREAPADEPVNTRKEWAW